MTPFAMIAPTHRAAASTLSKPRSSARASGGLRKSLTVTSVTTPSSPSEPVMSPMRS